MSIRISKINLVLVVSAVMIFGAPKELLRNWAGTADPNLSNRNQKHSKTSVSKPGLKNLPGSRIVKEPASLPAAASKPRVLSKLHLHKQRVEVPAEEIETQKIPITEVGQTNLNSSFEDIILMRQDWNPKEISLEVAMESRARILDTLTLTERAKTTVLRAETELFDEISTLPIDPTNGNIDSGKMKLAYQDYLTKIQKVLKPEQLRFYKEYLKSEESFIRVGKNRVRSNLLAQYSN